MNIYNKSFLGTSMNSEKSLTDFKYSKKSITKLFFTFKGIKSINLDQEIVENLEESQSENMSVQISRETVLTCFYKGCEKKFLSRAALDAHEYLHLTEKPYKCDNLGCMKVFPNLCRLNLHKRIHNGEKPFKCTICWKSFNEKGNLKTHLRIHTGEKPYCCNFKGCTQAFRALGHLKDHEKKHFGIKPFECRICESKFSRSSTLKIHVRTHSTEKLHQCPVISCGKRFREKGNMKNHYKLHLIKTNIFHLEEMKVEKIHSFELKNEIQNKESLNLEKFHNSSTQTEVGENTNQTNVTEGPIVNNPNLLLQSDLLGNPAINQFFNHKFLSYLQNSFNLSEIYNIFKPNV